jgi:ABC-type phosphate transport system substrate-binding protein
MILMTLLLLGIFNAYGQVAVIVNKSVSETTIDSDKLASVYDLIQKQWEDGSKIVVFDLKSSDDIRTTFYKFIKRDPNHLRKEWMKAQLTGEARAPRALKSEDEMVSEVAGTDGAIGFVSASKVTDDVKVLLTIE